MTRRGFYSLILPFLAWVTGRTAKAEPRRHCVDCQWWMPPNSLSTAYGKVPATPYGMCVRNSSPNCLYELTPSQPFLFTLPAFGCVHFEKK